MTQFAFVTEDGTPIDATDAELAAARNAAEAYFAARKVTSDWCWTQVSNPPSLTESGVHFGRAANLWEAAEQRAIAAAFAGRTVKPADVFLAMV